MDKGHYYRPLSLFHSSLAVSQNSGLTNQALRIHCSAKNFLTMWHIYSITACCVGIYRQRRRLRRWKLPCNLLLLLLLLLLFIQVNGKVHPKTRHEGPEGEYGYSSTLSLISALDRSGWSTPRPGRFTPGKETRDLLYRRLGGPQGRSRRVQKISSTPGFDLRTVQPVASRYTDYAIPAVLLLLLLI